MRRSSWLVGTRACTAACPPLSLAASLVAILSGGSSWHSGPWSCQGCTRGRYRLTCCWEFGSCRVGRIEEPSEEYLLATADRTVYPLRAGSDRSLLAILGSPLVGSQENADHAALICHRLQRFAYQDARTRLRSRPAHRVPGSRGTHQQVARLDWPAFVRHLDGDNAGEG